MEDDLICSLTRQVKEEVVENYLTERCLVGYQIEDMEKQAEDLRLRSMQVGKRFSRLAYLMIHPEMLERLAQLLDIQQGSFWRDCMDRKHSREIRFIRVRALTDKGRFRKLVLEAYNRLYQWMEKYRGSYDDFKTECEAVNSNITKFQKNFDLLTIINFLKNLDTGIIERKQFLGENFTAEELSSIDEKLYLHKISFEKLDIPSPIFLSKPDQIEPALSDLAQEVYRKYQPHVKRIME